jgi:hypothetical protein
MLGDLSSRHYPSQMFAVEEIMMIKSIFHSWPNGGGNPAAAN